MKILSLVALLLSSSLAAAQTHGHINAGAQDIDGLPGINSGDRLHMYFEPGTQLTTLAANSGTGVSGADGFRWNGYTTFTALHQSSQPSSPSGYDSLGALSGSFLVLRLDALAGPLGARFAFYDSGDSDPRWIYQIGTGFLLGDGQITLTQPSYYAGSPGNGIPSDPFGHIHGRTFGVDAAGDFTATWILQDREAGATGLLDSAPFTSDFSAAPVPEPSTWLLLLGGVGLLVLAARSPHRDSR